MRGAILVALAAAVGNMLQGWDNSTITAAMFIANLTMYTASLIIGYILMEGCLRRSWRRHAIGVVQSKDGNCGLLVSKHA
ncbi:unnamed protein product [Rhodiola kirilowii]